MDPVLFCSPCPVPEASFRKAAPPTHPPSRQAVPHPVSQPGQVSEEGQPVFPSGLQVFNLPLLSLSRLFCKMEFYFCPFYLFNASKYSHSSRGREAEVCPAAHSFNAVGPAPGADPPLGCELLCSPYLQFDTFPRRAT